MELFRLFGRILINNDEANARIAETDARAEKTGRTLRDTVLTAAKWGAGIAAAAGAAGGALLALANKAAGTAGDLNDLSDRAGTNTTVFQEMRYAMSQVGVAESDVSMSLQRLNQRLGQAEEGSSKYNNALDRLGISTRNANDELKSSDELFMELVTRLHEVGDSQLQAALAADIFGVNLAQRMLPAIKAGGDEIYALRNRAHDLGIVIGEDVVDAGAAFSDTMTDIQAILGTLTTRLTMSVMPHLQVFLNWIMTQLPKTGAVFQFIGEVIEIVFRYMRLIIGDSIAWMRDNAISPFVNWLANVWQERGPPIIAALEGLFEGVKYIFGATLDVLKGLWGAFILAFQGDWEGAWETVKQTFSDLWSQIPGLFAGIWDPLVSLAHQIMTAVIDVIRAVFGDNVAQHFQSIWNAVLLVFDTFKETFMGVWRAFTALFKGDWEAAWSELKATAETIWTAIPVVFETIVSAIIGIADTIMQSVIGVIRAVFGDQVADVFQVAWDAVVTVFEGARDIVLGIWTAITAALQGDWDGAWRAIVGVLQTAWDTIRAVWDAIPVVFEATFNALIGIADTIMTAVVVVIRDLFGDNIADHFQGVWDAVKLVFQTVFDALMGVWSAFAALFRGDWGKAWGDLVGAFALIWDSIPGIVSEILNNVFGIVDTVMQGLIALIRQTFGDGVAEVFERAWETVTILFETARDTLLGILQVFTSLFKGDWEQAWNDVVAVFARIWDGIVSIFTGPLDFISEFVTTWVGRITGAFSSLKDTVTGYVSDLVNGIVEWFSESKLGQTFEWLNGQINGVIGWFYDMYDKVVGNSYVPDMVEEIGEAIARLKDRLANPVALYTQQVMDSFSDMEDEAAASVMRMAEAMDRALDGIASAVSRMVSSVSRDLFNGTATWLSVLDSFAGTIGAIFGSVFDEIVKELAVMLIKQNEWLVKTLANIATTITAYLSQAYAMLVAFYAWSGPAAPVLAGATIAAAIAGIAAIGGSIIRGIMPGAPGGGTEGPDPGSRTPSAGRQVSEITGPTRDLLTDLLTPLANLNSLTGIGERIYNLLDERLVTPGLPLTLGSAGGPQISVTVAPGAVQVVLPNGDRREINIDNDTIEQIARRLAEIIAFEMRGASLT